MNKILLVCPALPDDMPYIRQYLDFLESSNTSYDVIYLCSKGASKEYPQNYHACMIKSPDNSYAIKKIWGYYKYSRFVVKRLAKGGYTHVITMGIACSVFLSNYLRHNYTSRYIYDIRDYSQVLRIPIFKLLNKLLLKYSYMNVISSGGFKQWLPSGVDYTLCHNTTLDKIENGVCKTFDVELTGAITILTIGQVRDLEANTFVIEQLSNKDDFELTFSGIGLTLEKLEKLVKDNAYSNVEFTGKYKKEDEDVIVKNATLLNVCMESNMVSNYLLSNRLYLAARLKRPLISFDGSYQANLIQKYNLGLIVKRSDILSEKIKGYIASFNPEEFEVGCQKFLDDVKRDLLIFIGKMNNFIKCQTE